MLRYLERVGAKFWKIPRKCGVSDLQTKTIWLEHATSRRRGYRRAPSSTSIFQHSIYQINVTVHIQEMLQHIIEMLQRLPVVTMFLLTSQNALYRVEPIQGLYVTVAWKKFATLYPKLGQQDQLELVCLWMSLNKIILDECSTVAEIDHVRNRYTAWNGRMDDIWIDLYT